MHDEDVPPGPQLMESMRAVGYTLESALADLVDNSISASSKNVCIYVSSIEDGYVSVVDDGEGMTAGEAREAMKLAPASAREHRSQNDLGRFGLGLKTASLSQCRDVTLVSKTAAGLVGVRWNLEHLARTGRWSLLILNDQEIADLPDISVLLKQASGTMVLWRDLDRLLEGLGGVSRALDEKMATVREHLQLVFHRFLAGEHGKKLAITLNSVNLKQIDPFLSNHASTQIGPLESFKVDGQIVSLRPFTLPIVGRLSARDREKALLSSGLRDSQGFYIYRGMRLVIWGTWFRILRKDELGKLARVKVDIPNSLDHLWALDIKKSAAVPPANVRSELRRVAVKIVSPSKVAQLYRGRPRVDQVTRTWNLIEDRSTFRYEINRDHPIVSRLTSLIDPAATAMLEELIALLESTFPVEDAHNRLGQDQLHSSESGVRDLSNLSLASAIWASESKSGMGAEEFVKIFAQIEPFNRSSNPTEILKKATEIQ